MARQKLDKEVRKAISDAKKMIEYVSKMDGNEAETRQRVERIFEGIMGYHIRHLSREHAVKGPGETEHCDFAIYLDEQRKSKPVIFVELKKVNIDLAAKHLKQVSSYAINAGCEWMLLTNGRQWQLYHVAFGQPPETKRVESWNLLHDDPIVLAKKFALISYKNVKKGKLEQLWQTMNTLTHGNLLSAIISDGSLRLLRRQLKKTTGVLVTPEEVIGAVRRLLNESAAAEMENLKISLPVRKRRTRAKKQDPLKPSGNGPKEAADEKTTNRSGNQG